MKKTKGVQREMYEQKKKVDNFRRCALCKITTVSCSRSTNSIRNIIMSI